MFLEESSLLKELILDVVLVKLQDHFFKNFWLFELLSEELLKLVETPIVKVGHVVEPEAFVNGSDFTRSHTRFRGSTLVLHMSQPLFFSTYAYLFWVFNKADFDRYEERIVFHVMLVSILHFSEGVHFNCLLRLYERDT